MISVCMATYNGEKYIKEQLESILVQLNEEDEIIISDDKSSDKTLDIIRSLKDHRIKIFENPGNRGYTKNFENAINESSGDIIFLSDQDDVWIDGKLEKMVDKLKNTFLVVSDAKIVNKKLQVISKSHFNLYNVSKGFILNFLKTRYIGACMCFKREILQKALPFPKKSENCAHDYWLTLVAEFYYNVELCEVPLLLYRRHSNNALDGGYSSSNSFFKKVWTRLYCFYNLILRYAK
jgi:glycosyltransferase involved in cell wall biosynthesis